jgi:hypothetical protein
MTGAVAGAISGCCCTRKVIHSLATKPVATAGGAADSPAGQKEQDELQMQNLQARDRYDSTNQAVSAGRSDRSRGRDLPRILVFTNIAGKGFKLDEYF